jgi:hypothetical protein
MITVTTKYTRQNGSTMTVYAHVTIKHEILMLAVKILFWFAFFLFQTSSIKSWWVHPKPNKLQLHKSTPSIPQCELSPSGYKHWKTIYPFDTLCTTSPTSIVIKTCAHEQTKRATSFLLFLFFCCSNILHNPLTKIFLPKSSVFFYDHAFKLRFFKFRQV